MHAEDDLVIGWYGSDPGICWGAKAKCSSSKFLAADAKGILWMGMCCPPPPIGPLASPEVVSVQLFVVVSQLCKKAGHILQLPLNTQCHQNTCSCDTVAQ